MDPTTVEEATTIKPNNNNNNSNNNSNSNRATDSPSVARKSGNGIAPPPIPPRPKLPPAEKRHQRVPKLTMPENDPDVTSTSPLTSTPSPFNKRLTSSLSSSPTIKTPPLPLSANNKPALNRTSSNLSQSTQDLLAMFSTDFSGLANQTTSMFGDIFGMHDVVTLLSRDGQCLMSWGVLWKNFITVGAKRIFVIFCPFYLQRQRRSMSPNSCSCCWGDKVQKMTVFGQLKP